MLTKMFGRHSVGFCLLFCQALSYTSLSTVNQMKLSNRSLRNTFRRSSTGHEANVNMPKLSTEDQSLLEKLRESQSKMEKLSYAEEVRTLIEQSIGYGVLSTNSVQYEGYPTGSVVGFSLEDNGLPFFVFSSMSAHTTDIKKDQKCSLTVMASNFKGAAEGRIVLIGDVNEVKDDEKKNALREKYRKKHPEAYWIDFGDFTYFEMSSLKTIRFVGGFAMAGSVTAEDYIASKPDPIAPFAVPVMTHMNDDHADSIISMVKHYAGVPCSEAQIVSMDRLGMFVKAKIDIPAGSGGTAKIRLPFPRSISERKAVKEVLVEMTRASSTD